MMKFLWSVVSWVSFSCVLLMLVDSFYLGWRIRKLEAHKRPWRSFASAHSTQSPWCGRIRLRIWLEWKNRSCPPKNKNPNYKTANLSLQTRKDTQLTKQQVYLAIGTQGLDLENIDRTNDVDSTTQRCLTIKPNLELDSIADLENFVLPHDTTHRK